MPSSPSRPASRRNPRQDRSRITVNAILEAAARVFTARGYERGSTNTIAAVAGVSVGSLYQYFPDKLSLLGALRDRHLTTMMSAMASACRQRRAGGLGPTLRAIIDTAVHHHAERAALVRAFALHLPRDDQKPSRAALLDFQSALRDLLDRHRSELRLADHELALLLLRNLGRSFLQAAAESRPQDLHNGAMARELHTSAMALLTGRTSRPASSRERDADFSHRGASNQDGHTVRSRATHPTGRKPS